MQLGNKLILSIIAIAIIAAIVIAYYQTASNKVVAARCDKSKRVCQIRNETTHFGGFFQIYSYYYVPFPVYGAGLGIFSSGLGFGNPIICNNCLEKITNQDEQQIIKSKSPVLQSELSSQLQVLQSPN
jgi:hypothetical protein